LLQLALRFGQLPSVLAATITLSEFTEYKALYNLDPWGEERQDFRAALNTAVVATAFGGGVPDVERYAFGTMHARVRALAKRTDADITAQHRAAFGVLNSRLPTKG